MGCHLAQDDFALGGAEVFGQVLPHRRAQHKVIRRGDHRRPTDQHRYHKHKPWSSTSPPICPGMPGDKLEMREAGVRITF